MLALFVYYIIIIIYLQKWHKEHFIDIIMTPFSGRKEYLTEVIITAPGSILDVTY